jgi:hypothetical protein
MSNTENEAEVASVKPVRSVAELIKQYVWIVGMKRFCRRSDGMLLDVHQFNSKFNHLLDRSTRSKIADLLFLQADTIGLRMFDRGFIRTRKRDPARCC